MGVGGVPETRRVLVGVLLPPPPEDIGEWLADAAAFDAAGADALWVDAARDAGLDPLAVTAALATLTFRSLLVTVLPGISGGPPAHVRTLATVARLSRGRLALCGDRSQLADVTGGSGDSSGASTGDSSGDSTGGGGGASTGGGGDWPDLEIFHRLDDGVFLRARKGGDPERWVRTAAPDGRAAWQAAVAEAAERGLGGLLVPAGPRLLDILRNPSGPDDRRDLQLAQG
jgi:hypothetical protein